MSWITFISYSCCYYCWDSKSSYSFSWFFRVCLSIVFSLSTVGLDGPKLPSSSSTLCPLISSYFRSSETLSSSVYFVTDSTVCNYALEFFSSIAYRLFTAAAIAASFCGPEPPFWNCCNSSFSCLISVSYYFKSASFGSSFTRGLFLIAFAREAYLKVESVSSKL